MMHGEWPILPLENICCRISSGGTPSRANPSYFVEDGHLWVKSKELLDGPIYVTEETISDEALAHSSAKYFPEGTILLAMYGATVGQLGILRRQATVNQAICGLVVDETIACHEYVFYELLHMRHGLIAKAFGAAQQNLNQDLIRRFGIPLPPLPIQRKIAAILSAYDDLIENNTRRIALLEAMAQALYREWFVRFRFPGHEAVPLVDTPLGAIPEGWQVVKLGDIAHEVRRSVDPASLDPDTPYVGLEHMPRKSIALSDWGIASQVESTKLLFKRGEILFGKIRPYFHKVVVAPIDGVCSTDAIVIVPQSEDMFPLVLCCVSSDEFVSHATQTSQGTKMPRANWDVLTQFPLALPDENTRRQFDTIISDAVAQIENLTFQIRNLRQTRDLLLPRLVSGAVDVAGMEVAMGEKAERMAGMAGG